MHESKFSEPGDYYEEINGEVLPPRSNNEDKPLSPTDYDYIGEEDHLLDERIRDAAIRVGHTAVTPAGRAEGMSDEEWLSRLREERESDRQGTHPGTTPELTPEQIEASRKAAEEREKEIKKQKKINEAISIVQRIKPTTQDSSQRAELTKAEKFLRKNGLNPEDYVPDYWK